MKVEILHLMDGARSAQGLTVIIDVFRAFTTACYLANNRASLIIPVATIQEAYAFKSRHPDYILVGERNGQQLNAADYGNSPSEIELVDFSGKTVVLTTTSGTQGLLHATSADQVITGALVNADAIVQYIINNNPEQVSLVCMGDRLQSECAEDTLCAEYIKNRLNALCFDFQFLINSLRNAKSARKFFDVNCLWAPQRDFELCVEHNRFDFVLRLNRNNQNPALEKIIV